MRRVLLVLLAIAIVPSPAVSQDCVDYGDYPHWVGGVDTPGFAASVAVSGNYAYVADNGSGLQVIDILVPESPVLVGAVVTPGEAVDVAIAGNYAYVTWFRVRVAPPPIGTIWAHGLQVIDISMPESPEAVGAVDTSHASVVAVAGDYAYVGGRAGLHVIDISVPESPALVGSLDFSHLDDAAVAGAVAGNYAYVAWSVDYTARSVLQVIDISVSDSPAIVGGVDLPGGSRAIDVAVAGDYAYVVGAGLRVIDISVPESPALVGAVDTPGMAAGVAVSGNYAYVSGAGLRVIDISVPESPALVGAVDTPGPARGVAVTEEYAYVADGSGLQIAWLQCDDSEQQVTIDIKPGSEENPINCEGNSGVIPVAVLTTDTFDALTIDHTTVRFGPRAAAEVHTRKAPKPNGNGAVSLKSFTGVPKRHEEDVDHDGDLDLVFHFARAETGIVCGDTEAVLTGKTYDGQSILGSDTIQTVPDGDVEPEPQAMVQISPNPFNPATTIAFVVSEPQHVTVRVYDVRGQLVAELADGTYLAGQHQLEWRGRDTSGRVVSSGMYFFRIDRGGQVEIRKALLIK